MGRWPGEFLRLSLCKESSDTARGADLGGVSVTPFQLASNIRHPSFRHAVRAHRVSNRRYIQEVPVKLVLTRKRQGEVVNNPFLTAFDVEYWSLNGRLGRVLHTG